MPKLTAAKKRAWAGVLLMVLALPAHAGGMRCGTHLISKGDTRERVLEYCGEPVEKRAEMSLQAGVYVDKRSGLRVNGHDDVSVSRGYYLPYGRTEVLRENWVYNFGPNKLMRQVTFDNGIVADVQTLEYGYNE